MFVLYDKISSLEFAPSLALGEPWFSDARYTPIAFSKDNFQELQAKPGVLCAVDGGNCEIISTPSFSLSLLRVFAVVFNGEKRTQSETHDFLCFVKNAVRNGRVSLETRLDALGETQLTLPASVLSFDASDSSIARQGYRASPSAMAGVLRSFLEWMLAEKKLRSLDEGVVVKDGTLQTSFSGEAQFARKAFDAARASDVKLCALAKTSSLLTSSGMPLVEAINRMAPAGAWFYFPIVQNEHPDHQADIFACKLHAQSKHAFRFELLRGQELGCALENLAFQARDAYFLGYPYALVVADAFARVSQGEAALARALVEAKLGVSFEDVLKSERAIDAHDWL